MAEPAKIHAGRELDPRFDKWVGIALSVYFAMILYSTILLSVIYKRPKEEWRIGDWLINYSGGFVRRGASGELLLFLSRFFHLDLVCLTVFIQLFLYAIVLGSAWWFLRRQKEYIFEFILLIVSPGLFNFELLNLYGFRKELLFFVLLCILACLAVRRPSKTHKYLLIALYIMPILILCHEMLIIFTPYLFLLAMTVNPEISLKHKTYWIPLSLIMGTFAVAVYNAGNLQVVLSIKSSLEGLVPETVLGQDGAIDALNRTTVYALDEVKERIYGPNRYVAQYSLALLLSAVAFFPAFGRVKTIFSRWEPRLLFAASLVGTLGLMAVAIDWGRFIYTNALSLAFVVLCTHSQKHQYPKVTILQVIAIGAAAILYAVVWKLPVFGEVPYLNFWQYIF